MRLLVLCALAAVTTLAQAAPAPDHYRARTAAELAKVCSTPASDADAATAAAFCHGVLAGAYGYYMSATKVEDRYICVPDPGPTRAQVAQAFVDWIKARPNLASDGAINALFRYASEAFPCRK